MSAIIEKALALWGMSGAQYHLVAARENEVFKVTTETNTFALRLHRKGYRSDAELWSELKWMEAVAQGGIAVPAPVPSLSGEVLHVVDGKQIDVLTWLSGSPMGKTGDALDTSNRKGLFHRLGQEMARLHEVSDAWTQPQGFVRCAWNRDGLLGEKPLWDRFWDNSTLSPVDRQLFLHLRETANADLAKLEGDLDYGLIHADLVRENVIIDGTQLKLIDFDDGGFGFRVFDIATVLVKNLRESDYLALRAALISGYTSVREIDDTALDLFIVLRSATYVGWNISRLGEEGSDIRNERFICATRRLAEDYLASVGRRVTSRLHGQKSIV